MTGDGVNQTAIVTGAGRGIGAAIAKLLGGRGWRVAVVDLDGKETHSVVTDIRDHAGTAVAIEADVSSLDDWTRVIATVRTELGPVAALVSNAAHNSIAPLDEITPESWGRHLDVNLTGAFLGVQAALPDLRAAEGSVVMVSSVHAGFGLPLHAAYAAGKAGLEGLARQLAAELGPAVRVNAVRPGPVMTEAWTGISEENVQRSAASTILGRLGEPDEVAQAVGFLAGAEAAFITGAVLTVDGGWSVAKDSA